MMSERRCLTFLIVSDASCDRLYLSRNRMRSGQSNERNSMSRITQGRAQWIISNAQCSVDGNPNELSTVPLNELVQADEYLGSHDVDVGYRIHLRNRIDQLRRERDAREQKTTAIWNYVIVFFCGLGVALIAIAADRYWFSG